MKIRLGQVFVTGGGNLMKVTGYHLARDQVTVRRIGFLSEDADSPTGWKIVPLKSKDEYVWSCQSLEHGRAHRLCQPSLE